MYNFLLTKLPSSDDSRENSDMEEQNTKSKLAPKVWDQISEKQESACSGAAERGSEIKEDLADQMNEVIGEKEKASVREDVVVGGRLGEKSMIEQNDDSKLQWGQNLDPMTIASVHAKRIVKHRRTQSEDRLRLDLNGNYLAKGYILNAPVDSTSDGHTKRNLGYISENDSKGSWNAFDARNYQASERLIRREIPPIRGIRINQQLLVPESSEKKLNGSLTQLNLDGAISSNAIRAIQRSSSSSNCAVLTGDEAINENFSRSWTMPRKVDNEIPSKNRVQVRLQKTASAYFPSAHTHLRQKSALEGGYARHTTAMVSNTVSLV